jgi:hypothetical protein
MTKPGLGRKFTAMICAATANAGMRFARGRRISAAARGLVFAQISAIVGCASSAGARKKGAGLE